MWKDHVMIFQKYVVIFKKHLSCREIVVYKVLSIGRHLEISLLLLMSAKNTETITFVSLKLCFLGFVHHHNELFFSGVLSINSQVQEQI